MLLRNFTDNSDKIIVLSIEDDEKKWIQESFPDYLVFQFLNKGISFKITNENFENIYFGNLIEYLIDFLRKMNNIESISTVAKSHILQYFVNDNVMTIPRFIDKFNIYKFNSISNTNISDNSKQQTQNKSTSSPSYSLIRVRLVLNSSNNDCFDTIKMELNAFRYGYAFPPLNILEIEPYNKSHFSTQYKDGKWYYKYLDNTEANCLLLISGKMTHLVNKWQLINKWYKMIKNSEDNQISDKRFIRHPYHFNIKIKVNVMSKVIEKAFSRENKATFYVYDLDNNGSIKQINDY